MSINNKIKKQTVEIMPLIKRTVGGREPIPAKIYGQVSLAQKIYLVQHLATMLKAELPLKKALAALEKQTPARALKKIIADVLKNLDAGKPLSGTLKNYPKIFDEIFISLIAAGEENDNLKNSFQQLALLLQKEQRLNSAKRRAALTRFFNKRAAQKENSARFWRVFSCLLKMGVPQVFALNITARAVKNRAYRQTLFDMANQIKKGAGFGALLQDYPKIFSKTDQQMVWVAEKSNALPEISSELADMYEEEFKQLLSA
ncbi:MAG: type II secretion system F family protein [Patescibacteria group bacterium]|nr:type II secretion system F family protein [Patescibacteria group bacterium]